MLFVSFYLSFLNSVKWVFENDMQQREHPIPVVIFISGGNYRLDFRSGRPEFHLFAIEEKKFR